ncbi:zinc finger MYM-type protein 1-like [Eleginops maclovinus]|uniref:zinc finger MYM-type protein 1-like n=1 Tax=Eleginops maclovinus TaxID=56733 RepID=UPI0030804AAE
MERFLIKPPKKTSSDAQTSTSAQSTNGRPNEDNQSSEGVRKKGRSFQASWKTKFPWIAYATTKDKVFCEVCTTAKKMNAPLPSTTHDQESFKGFVQDGFSSWSKSLERFRSHEKSNLHRIAASIVAAANAGVNVAASISAGKLKQMSDARIALLAVLSSIQYLSCQGLAIRGKTDQASNLIQLLNLRAEDIPELQSWLARKESKWLSHDILNEMTEIMAHDVMRTLIGEIKSAEFFSVIMDETADITVKEQVSICFRFVTEDLEPEELFLGFYQTSKTTAETLFQLLKDVLVRFSLPVSKCRGQCYDGASNVSGIRTGLQARMRELEPRAQYIHCTAHVMNLVVHDVAQNIPPCRNFMVLIRDMVTLIRNSPKRLTWFQEFQGKDASSLKPLCPTRWTMTTASLQAIASNYSALLEFLEDLSLNEKGDAGVNAALQKRSLHLQKARQMVDTLREDIKCLREEGFQGFWENTTAAAHDLNLESPAVPRPRKIPRRLEDGGLPHCFQTPETMYRQQFFEIMDTASTCLDCRFSPSVFERMQDVEDFLIGKGDCKSIMEFYRDDLDEKRLRLHRDMCIDLAKQRGVRLASFQDVVDFLKGNQGEHLRIMLPEMTKLVKLALTVPVTSCSSERSFSGLRRLKTYLRSTMGQARLTHIAVLNTHKDVSRNRNLDVIADEFIKRTAARSATFLIKK